jgi:hypothetical protein
MLSGVEGIIHGINAMQMALQECGKLPNVTSRVTLQHSSQSMMNEVGAHRKNALFLIQRAKLTGQAISDFLNFQNQATAQEQSLYRASMTASTMKDSFNVRVITLVTLFYLPFSFLAVSASGANEPLITMVLTSDEDYSRNGTLRFRYSFKAYHCLERDMDILCGWNTIDGTNIAILEVEGACASEGTFEFIRLK